MPEQIRRRNPVALSPLLRKGGVHTRSNSVVRQGRRASLNQELEDWREELEIERSLSVREYTVDAGEPD